MKAIEIFIAVMVISFILFLAGVGALFLFTTEATPTTADTCDVIKRIDNQLWCMNRMQSEDDNIKIIRAA